MNQICVVTLVSLVSITVPLNVIAIPSSQIHPLQKESQNRDFLQHHTLRTLISLEPSNLPVVPIEDWRVKDAKLPWNQLVLHKTPNAEERVVFTKSYKFKVGWVAGRKERIHARWTQNNVELSIMAGFGCSWVFGCDTRVNYAPPKQIKVTVSNKDYFLTTVDQNTYGLTPELKQVITQTSTPLNFRVDERIKFEVKEEAIPALKQLFTPQETSSIPSSASSGIKPSNPML
jgi:hypothetical protein